MSCSQPIGAAVFSDYWLGALAGAEEDALEEHLMECGACGDRLRGVIALAEGLRELARAGALRMVVSDEFLRAAAGQGLTVRRYDAIPGGSVQCTVTAEDDLLIARLAADFAWARRVDLSLCDEQGQEQQRLADIPVHGGTDAMVLQESITHAKALPSHTMIMRLLAIDDSGGESVLGEYTFHHTRTMP
jgi:hypothetical protein